MRILKTTYYNSLGEVVSKEAYENELNCFYQKLNDDYEKRLNKLISLIPLGLSEEEQIRFVFNYLVNNVDYAHETISNNINGYGHFPTIKLYNNWGITYGDKYSPLLLKRSVCAGLAPVVNDICAKLGIESTSIYGETKILKNGSRCKHVWNVIKINGVPSHLDVVYGIYNREKGMDPFEFCLISDEKLRQVGPHGNYDTKIFDNAPTKK